MNPADFECTMARRTQVLFMIFRPYKKSSFIFEICIKRRTSRILGNDYFKRYNILPLKINCEFPFRRTHLLNVFFYLIAKMRKSSSFEKGLGLSNFKERFFKKTWAKLRLQKKTRQIKKSSA